MQEEAVLTAAFRRDELVSQEALVSSELEAAGRHKCEESTF